MPLLDIRAMDPARRVEELIAPTLNDMGYDCVRVQITGTRRMTLQVMAERTDGAPMTVDDCAGLSRELSAILDVEDPVSGSYTLEVSSPGIDRPLVKRQDFERFAGFEAKIETSGLIDGRRKFTGVLLGPDAEDRIHIRIDGADVALPLAEIRKAKLLLTDALIAAAERRTV